jgi:hypothetical protein
MSANALEGKLERRYKWEVDKLTDKLKYLTYRKSIHRGNAGCASRVFRFFAASFSDPIIKYQALLTSESLFMQGNISMNVFISLIFIL